LICDDITRACLAFECQTRDVTPQNYADVLKEWKPDMLLVESVWFGFQGTWKFKLASYRYRPWRNNRILKKVLSHARDLGIPCVFWNKEDSVHFERFSASARLFDYIFTVDENAIPRYRALVGPAVPVHPLMFAIQPALHSPGDAGPRFNRAAFLGSYSSHIHPGRRAWQDLLFSATKELGLTVFDRNSQRQSKTYRYPSLPWMTICNAVPHDQTARIYRDYAVNLNVNTIEDSGTMYSRRLVEILACAGMAVTTPALSINRFFRDYCHTVHNADEARELLGRIGKHGLTKEDREMCAAGANYVVQQHTWAQRLQTILEVVK
jgi:spore maturation protein CgeB